MEISQVVEQTVGCTGVGNIVNDALVFACTQSTYMITTSSEPLYNKHSYV